MDEKPSKPLFGVRIVAHYVVPGLVNATGKPGNPNGKFFSHCHLQYLLKEIRVSNQPFCVLKFKISGGNHIEA